MITVVKAISDYFGPKNGGRKVTLDEMKALSPAEKRELAEGICAITGDVLVSAPAK